MEEKVATCITSLGLRSDSLQKACTYRSTPGLHFCSPCGTHALCRVCTLYTCATSLFFHTGAVEKTIKDDLPRNGCPIQILNALQRRSATPPSTNGRTEVGTTIRYTAGVSNTLSRIFHDYIDNDVPMCDTQSLAKLRRKRIAMKQCLSERWQQR